MNPHQPLNAENHTRRQRQGIEVWGKQEKPGALSGWLGSEVEPMQRCWGQARIPSCKCAHWFLTTFLESSKEVISPRASTRGPDSKHPHVNAGRPWLIRTYETTVNLNFDWLIYLAGGLTVYCNLGWPQTLHPPESQDQGCVPPYPHFHSCYYVVASCSISKKIGHGIPS